MIERVIGTFDTPWRVVRLGGTDHRPEHDVDFVFDVVDADDNLICETDNKEIAEAIVELPNMYYRLRAIAECKPAILCRVPNGEEVACPMCESFIRGGKEMMHNLGVEYDDKTTY